jgi:flagellar protein FliS
MNPTARSAYVESSVQTASPVRLLVMLYDRLVLDCRRALDLQDAGDHQGAHRQLVHAQDIVAELQATLDKDAWDGAAQLDGLYSHLRVQLVQANVRRDRGATAHCLELVTGLAEAWREAALRGAAATA